RGPDQAQQNTEQGGLAGAVRPQHAVNPAARDAQAEPVQGAHGAIGLGQAGRFDHSGHALELGLMGISRQGVFLLSQIKLRQSPRSRFGVSMFSRVAGLCLALLLTACASTPVQQAEPQAALAAERPLVMLVSIDGFRADYLDRGITPNLSRLAGEGATGPMRPSFPSVTFPNHYTLVTGLHPDHHGIVGNNMIDAELGRF